MDFEKYTDRARGFVQSAQSLALREGHQQFTPEHLLKVLLDDPEGLASGLIDRAGGRSREALSAVEAALAKLNETGPCSQNQLGRLIYLDAATTKGVVDRLEVRNLISARPDANDRRRRAIALTEAGRAVAEKAVFSAEYDWHRDPLTPIYYPPIVPTLLRLAGCRVLELPVGHRARKHGRSNYTNFGRLAVAWSDMNGVRWLRKRRKSPGGVDEI